MGRPRRETVVELRMLGPVQARATGRPVELGPARQRSVLVALAVDAGRPVPVDTLIDRVWGENPPGQARAGLYSYITRLRRILTAAHVSGEPPVRLSSQPGGYLLDVAADRVDLHRFGRLLDRSCGEADDDRRNELLPQRLRLAGASPRCCSARA